MVEIIILLVILFAAGFGLNYLKAYIDPPILSLLRAIIIIFTVIFIILLILDLFGIMSNPIHLPHKG